MSKQLIPNDESLVKELYEKLEWYTFEADETEFSAEQVNAIITLLDALDPEGTYDPAKNSKSSRYHIFADGAGTGKASNIEDPLDAAAAFSRFKKNTIYRIAKCHPRLAKILNWMMNGRKDWWKNF